MKSAMPLIPLFCITACLAYSSDDYRYREKQIIDGVYTDREDITSHHRYEESANSKTPSFDDHERVNPLKFNDCNQGDKVIFDEPMLKVQVTPRPVESVVEPPKPIDGCAGFDGKKVYIVADDGNYLARCHGCGKATHKDSVTVHGRQGEGFAMWTLKSVNGKCAMLSDTNQYAARCRNCWSESKVEDGIFIYLKTPDEPYAQWTIEKHGDQFAFKADTGKYMARCYLCITGLTKPNAATVHFDSPSGPALWRIQLVN